MKAVLRTALTRTFMRSYFDCPRAPCTAFPSTRPFSSISPANVRQLVTCSQAPRSVRSLLNARYKNSWTQSDLASTLTEEEKMTLVKAEYELYRAEEETQVPSSLTENEWEELARLPGVSRRKKYLRFLYLNEMKSINDKKKKLERRKIYEAKYQQLQVELKSESAHISYGLWRNSMFIKWSDQRINTVNSHRVVQAKLFGQPIIFDYDFDEKMVAREKKVLGTQVAECIGMNRQYLDPFYIHFCNFRREEESAQLTIKSVPTLTNEDFLVDLHPDNFLEVFPREKLVYLTPHCREEVREFDHDAVYIIGGLVDLRSDEPFTLAKAKRQRIKMQKLPLDRYLDWGTGRKSLTLNQIFGILLEAKQHGSWTKAFAKYIPPRKLLKPQYGDAEAIKKKMRQKHTSRYSVESLFKD